MQYFLKKDNLVFYSEVNSINTYATNKIKLSKTKPNLFVFSYNSPKGKEYNRSLIMDCDFRCTISSIEEPTFTIPKDNPFSNHVYINFHYCQVNFPLDLNASNSYFACRATMDRIFFIPCDILCNCDDANTFLYYTFSSMPISPDILKQIRPDIGKYAKEMVANNDDKWEMKAKLIVST